MVIGLKMGRCGKKLGLTEFLMPLSHAQDFQIEV